MFPWQPFDYNPYQAGRLLRDGLYTDIHHIYIYIYINLFRKFNGYLKLLNKEACEILFAICKKGGKSIDHKKDINIRILEQDRLELS